MSTGHTLQTFSYIVAMSMIAWGFLGFFFKWSVCVIWILNIHDLEIRKMGLRLVIIYFS